VWDVLGRVNRGANDTNNANDTNIILIIAIYKESSGRAVFFCMKKHRRCPMFGS
jgi:hypothetical protein